MRIRKFGATLPDRDATREWPSGLRAPPNSCRTRMQDYFSPDVSSETHIAHCDHRNPIRSPALLRQSTSPKVFAASIHRMLRSCALVPVPSEPPPPPPPPLLLPSPSPSRRIAVRSSPPGGGGTFVAPGGRRHEVRGFCPGALGRRYFKSQHRPPPAPGSARTRSSPHPSLSLPLAPLPLRPVSPRAL